MLSSVTKLPRTFNQFIGKKKGQVLLQVRNAERANANLPKEMTHYLTLKRKPIIMSFTKNK